MPRPTIYIMSLVLILFAGDGLHADDWGSFDLGVKQNRYLGAEPAPAQHQNYTFLSGRLDLTPHTQNIDFQLDAVSEGAMEDRNEFYFGVPEAFMHARNLAEGFDLVIGRQKRHWSRLDEEFNLGVWQPQLRWDYLQPEQQGLIGVFMDVHLSGYWRLTFLTSPLFLPDQGPNFQLKGGQFVSGNRWFMPPQSRVSLFQGTNYANTAPLYFELERPADDKIVMHSTLGGALSFAGPSNWWAQLAYAYKPRNQIHLGIECTNCAVIGGATPVAITAVVHPVIVMHNVATLEGGFHDKDQEAWLSFTYDRPNPSGLPADYEESPLDSMVIFGAAYEHYLETTWIAPSWMKVSYMETETVQKTDRRGLIDSDEVESSLDRYPYKQVAAWEWRIRFRDRSTGRIEFDTRYSYSIPERGGWWTAMLDLTVHRFDYSLGFDVLGSDVASDSVDAGLFARYRTNDRIFAGVSYVF